MRAPVLLMALLVLGFAGCAGTTPPAAEAMPPRPDPHAGTAVLSRINRERGGVGAAPLEPEPGLARAALDRALARHRGDALNEPALGSGLALEVSARGERAADVIERLLADAPSRSKLLNADTTHAGVAVVASDDQITLTVLSARLAPKADVEHAPARVASLLNQGRSARGSAPLVSDSTLQRAAAEAANRFFAPPLPGERELVDGLHEKLEPFGLAYARVEATVAVVTTVDEAATLEPAFDPGAVAVGVGVAQGYRPDHGRTVVCVVIVLGWSRQ